MIRLLTCLRKRDDIGDTEFRECWNSTTFQQLFERMVDEFKPIRFSRNLTLKITMNSELMALHGSPPPFDATLEYWWNNSHDLEAGIAEDASTHIVDKMLEFQSTFCDMKRSSTFFTEYNEESATDLLF